MKHILIAMIAVVISSVGFAKAQPINPSKQTQKLQALSHAWKSYHKLQGNMQKNDIEMVYGGADIKPSAMDIHPTHA